VPVLVVNAGSSSLKLRLLGDGDDLVDSADLPAGPAGIDAAGLADLLRSWTTPDAVGHRIVHGGTRFTGPVGIDGPVRGQLGDLTDLAPLHQPLSLAALDAVSAMLPGVPAVACFDTAFHATLSPAAATYAVPAEWRERYGVRRYGFHGLSHAYCTRRAPELLAVSPAGLRIVSCHLGAGASLAAVVDGRSVDTTMGFTPLEGLVMATRSGTVDPGMVLWLQEHAGLPAGEVRVDLEQRSGLTGLAGSGDLRVVEARAAAGEPDAVLALEVFLHRLVTGIGAMTAAAGGVDVITFTGGIGEHSAEVRRRTVQRLAFLGAVLDPVRNAAVSGDADITAPGATVRIAVLTAREDLQIARETRSLLRAGVDGLANVGIGDDDAPHLHPGPVPSSSPGAPSD